MNVTIGNCFDKLDLIEQMLKGLSSKMTKKEIDTIFNVLNETSIALDDWIDKQGVRDRK